MPGQDRSMRVVRQTDEAAALLDDTRRTLLDRLDQPDSAAGLARKLGLPRQRLNYHLRELERAGLVELVEERRRGNCTERVLVRTARAFLISPEVLGQLGPGPEAIRDRFSSAALVGAAASLIRDVAVARARAADTGKRVATLALNAEVRFESAATRNAFAEELTAAISTLIAKYHDETASGGRRFVLLVGCYPKVASDGAAAEKQGKGDRARA
jgi:DNA-binding transcriptional ArsR family regulator